MAIHHNSSFFYFHLETCPDKTIIKMYNISVATIIGIKNAEILNIKRRMLIKKP